MFGGFLKDLVYARDLFLFGGAIRLKDNRSVKLSQAGPKLGLIAVARGSTIKRLNSFFLVADSNCDLAQAFVAIDILRIQRDGPVDQVNRFVGSAQVFRINEGELE